MPLSAENSAYLEQLYLSYPENPGDLVQQPQKTCCGSIGVEYMHIPGIEETTPHIPSEPVPEIPPPGTGIAAVQSVELIPATPVVEAKQEEENLLSWLKAIFRERQPADGEDGIPVGDYSY
ncbi:MAG: hypothetical protein ACE5FQ_03225 [Thiogranum sp.]